MTTTDDGRPPKEQRFYSEYHGDDRNFLSLHESDAVPKEPLVHFLAWGKRSLMPMCYYLTGETARRLSKALDDAAAVCEATATAASEPQALLSEHRAFAVELEPRDGVRCLCGARFPVTDRGIGGAVSDYAEHYAQAVLGPAAGERA